MLAHYEEQRRGSSSEQQAASFQVFNRDKHIDKLEGTKNNFGQRLVWSLILDIWSSCGPNVRGPRRSISLNKLLYKGS